MNKLLLLAALALPVAAETQTEKNLADLKGKGTIVKVLCLGGYEFIVASGGNRSGVSVVQIFAKTKRLNSHPKSCEAKPAIPSTEAEIKAQAKRDALLQLLINKAR